MGGCMKWTEEDVAVLRSLSEVMMLKQAAQKMGRTVASIWLKAKSIGIKGNSKFKRKYKVNDDFFANKESLECLYWAGFIAADGCVCSPKKNCLRIKIKDTDIEHLKIFQQSIGYDGKLHVSKKNSNTYVCINIHSKKIVDDLAWFNITKRKSLTLEPPPLDGEQSLAFLIGYIDGDGCISIEKLKNRNERLRLSMVGTYNMICWAKAILDDIAPFSTNAKPRKTGKVFVYSIASKKALDALSELQKINVPKLGRKWNKIDQYRKKHEV